MQPHRMPSIKDTFKKPPVELLSSFDGTLAVFLLAAHASRKGKWCLTLFPVFDTTALPHGRSAANQWKPQKAVTILDGTTTDGHSG